MQPVIVVRANADDSAFHAGAEGLEGRRTDFVMLRDALSARYVDLGAVQASRLGRAVRAVAGAYVALAVLAFLQRRRVSAYVTGSENEAIVLALLLKLARCRVPLVAIGQYPAKAAKWPAWRLAKVHTHISRILPLGTVQAMRLINDLGVPASKVEAIPYGIDANYWCVEKACARRNSRPYVFAAGLQHRDYRTLIAAVDGLDVDLLICAVSPWSKMANALDGQALPGWVRFLPLSLDELRDAYAGAAVVVTTVVETDFPAGTTALLEGMAMARPAVVARAAGSGDYVQDRRSRTRDGSARETSQSFAARFGSVNVSGQTGLYFPPGNIEELRSVLRWVLSHPAEADEIGKRARQAVEQIYTVEQYVARITSAVLQARVEASERRPTFAAKVRKQPPA